MFDHKFGARCNKISVFFFHLFILKRTLVFCSITDLCHINSLNCEVTKAGFMNYFLPCWTCTINLGTMQFLSTVFILFALVMPNWISITIKFLEQQIIYTIKSHFPHFNTTLRSFDFFASFNCIGLSIWSERTTLNE